jgi:hypothetical protein
MRDPHALAVPVECRDNASATVRNRRNRLPRVRTISTNGERSMEMRTSLLAVMASFVLLGCNTVPDRDRTSGTKGEQPETLGKLAPYTAHTSLCISRGCLVIVSVVNCNVEIIDPVLNLGGGPPNPRTVLWLIADNDYTFSSDSKLPGLVVNKSGRPDPAFGTPIISGRSMWVQFMNNRPRLSHEYGLNIVKSDGTKCPTYDPWVIE